MTEEILKLTIGSLLHDVGKVIYRQGGDRRKHSQSGYDYMKDNIHMVDTDVLHCIRYHHADAIRGANLSVDDLSYIVYMADNIASAADRRNRQEEETGFEISVPLQPVFNILNGNHQNQFYHPGDLSKESGIHYPGVEKRKFEQADYTKIVHNLSEHLQALQWSKEYVNSLLEVLEANLSYIPSSTSRQELPDISLFDHLKLTAAAADCIYYYFAENGIKNYKQMLFVDGKAFYSKKVFLLASLDVSGIQKFIYTIATKNALKTLRARSFYLEIMMEHITDLLLEKMELSRTNLLYCGGGHCYLLLPDTSRFRKTLEEGIKEINAWFLEFFQTALYVAYGYVSCSSDDLKNVPEGAYAELYHRISEKVSEHKCQRYTASDILALNKERPVDHTRECSVCKRIGKVDSDGVCPICKSLSRLSNKVLYAKFFTVRKDTSGEGVPLPCGYELISDDEASLRRRMEEDEKYVRSYGKNCRFMGRHIATKLWVGSYTNGDTFEQFANESEGIKRIGVLRADVDNLGQTFVSGFEPRYATLSRTTTLSRQLSLFFKYYINQIMEEKERKATIVYSGGDDVFIVGAWNESIHLAIELQQRFCEYTEGTLTMSGGIGVYHDSYPISVIADEVERMVERSKSMPGKNSITLLEDGYMHAVSKDGRKLMISDGTYTWKELTEEVIGEKYHAIAEFFDGPNERGGTFLYHLLDLIRNQENKINFARYVYLLSRMEPDQKAEEQKKVAYEQFSQKMYQWVLSEKDRTQLKTAIILYVYRTRKEEDI